VQANKKESRQLFPGRRGGKRGGDAQHISQKKLGRGKSPHPAEHCQMGKKKKKKKTKTRVIEKERDLGASYGIVEER